MKDVLLIFGEGGHNEQMRRLLMKLGIPPERCVAIVDKDGIAANLASEEWVVPPLREKHRDKVNAISSNMIAFKVIRSIISKKTIRTLISTGPGIAILPSIVFRLLGAQIIHIETWSRFESRSLTGRVMYYIAQYFYVQNKSLTEIYPKAKYSGRL
jgi:UDP-N-acetylglucosamine:LPS N-acetylglucosamine transferase